MAEILFGMTFGIEFNNAESSKLNLKKGNVIVFL